jgi:hypothetical protein
VFRAALASGLLTFQAMPNPNIPMNREADATAGEIDIDEEPATPQRSPDDEDEDTVRVDRSGERSDDDEEEIEEEQIDLDDVMAIDDGEGPDS